MRIIKEESFDVVIHSWLRAEWIKHGYDRNYPQYQNLINKPDFDNPHQNSIRLELLNITRENILQTIPSDTRWYLASYEPKDISKLYIIASDDWLPISSETFLVASTLLNFNSEYNHAGQIREVHSTLPNKTMDTRPILVASSLESPMSIFEGNHRTIALLKFDSDNPKSKLLREVHIGISPNMSQSYWHIEHQRSRHLIK